MKEPICIFLFFFIMYIMFFSEYTFIENFSSKKKRKKLFHVDYVVKNLIQIKIEKNMKKMNVKKDHINQNMKIKGINPNL